MKRFKNWLKKRRQLREIDRKIPHSYFWYMNSTEKYYWRERGWRVTYWVCPDCGTRNNSPGVYYEGGWVIPKFSCCTGE